ncbi:hypothetical protein Tco_0835555 [Tanacetum coccineum]
MKLTPKRSLIQTHSSHASGSGVHEGTGVIPGVPDAPTYQSDDEEIPWKSSDEEDDDDEANSGKDKDDDDQDDDDNADYDDDSDRTDSDNNGDKFVHPKFTTHDDEGEKMNKEATNAGGEDTDLHKEVNVNLEGRDVEMTDAQQTNVQTTQVIEDTHVIITLVNPEVQQQSSYVSSGFVSNMLNPNPDLGIDSIFNVNTKATSLVDHLVTTLAEPPILSATTLPPPPTLFISNLQQTPVPTPAIFSSSSL